MIVYPPPMRTLFVVILSALSLLLAGCPAHVSRALPALSGSP